MASEIAAQPAVLARLLTDEAAHIGRVRKRLLQYRPRFVQFAARGTSDHAALYGKYLVETRLGLPAGLASLSSVTLYGARPDMSGVLFLAVSQSGHSPDVVEATAQARAYGALTVAVCNDPSSALAETAEQVIEIRAGAERAIAATKSYTAELLALYLFLGGGAADALPAAVEATLDMASQAIEAAQEMRHTDRLLFTARGLSYPTAREAALKVMETSYLTALAFSGADLLHGPLAVVDSTLPVVAVAGAGPTTESMAAVIARLEKRGARVLQVGPGRDLDIASANLEPDLAPIVEILPLQRLALELARARGIDPDRPRALSKITNTW
ncbi:MAG TPA: SIS domain-containing protein [Mycobacterium sp.]|nr:SIS domain-containing protein [Mycobacterium sp.]